MRVLHVIAGLALRTGGVATALVELAQGLESIGVETTIFSTDLGESAGARARTALQDADLPPGADAIDIRLFAGRAPRRLAYSPDLRRALRDSVSEADVVHVHGLWLHPTLAGGAEAFHAGVPYVVSPQGMFDPVLRQRGKARKALTTHLWQRRLLERAGCLHFTAEAEARLAADIARSVPRAVVPNPIDVSAFSGGDAKVFRARYLDGFDGPIVMNHGRIAWKKGLDELICAFALLAAEHPDALLVIVGPDDEGLTPALTELAASSGIGDRVRFLGLLNGAERRDALAAADVWVLASRTDAWPSAVTEALAAGLPLILSGAVNSAEDLERAGAARVVEVEPKALAEEISRLLDDSVARDELAHAAVEIAQRFDRDAVAEAMLHVYERVLRDRSAELGRRSPLMVG